MGVIALGMACALGLAAAAPVDTMSVALVWGSVTTSDGETVEGYLRWNGDDVSRSDYLRASRVIPREILRQAESLDPEFAEEQRKARSLVAFGERITWEEDDLSGPPTREVALRFEHVRAVVPLGDTAATVELATGGEVVLSRWTDGRAPSLRNVAVTESDGTVREVDWDEIVRVAIGRAPPGASVPPAVRLFGTVRTWGGLALTGPIRWDLDEGVTTDVLDGRMEGDDREIPFSDISEIEWDSDRTARVVLRSGSSFVLRGTNDVDRRNRGIEVADASLGRAVVRWSDFQSVRFHDPGTSDTDPDTDPGWTSLAELDPVAAGAPLRGSVFARDGRVLEGAIRWGHAQATAWESIVGWSGDVEVSVEFASVRSIAPDGEDGAMVTLRNGREIRLGDAPDVDERQAGIFVTPDDGRATRLVRWRDLDRVELSW